MPSRDLAVYDQLIRQAAQEPPAPTRPREIAYLCWAVKTPQNTELTGPLADQARAEHWM